jgi:hypothetical protein
MSEVPIPSEDERKAFLEKLGQLRDTLSDGEQRMLDAMAIAAFGAPEDEDVQGYQWFYAGPTPIFYQTGYALAWQATPWGYAYGTLPAGAWVP